MFLNKHKHTLTPPEIEALEKLLFANLSADATDEGENETYQRTLGDRLVREARTLKQSRRSILFIIYERIKMKLSTLFPLYRLRQAPVWATALVGVLAFSTITFASSASVRRAVLSPFLPKAWVVVTYTENAEVCEAMSPVVSIDGEGARTIPLKEKQVVGERTVSILRNDGSSYAATFDLPREGAVTEIACPTEGTDWIVTLLLGNQGDPQSVQPISAPLSAPISLPISVPISVPVSIPLTPTLPIEITPAPEPETEQEPNPHTPDITAPVITSFSLDKKVVTAGESITVTISAIDDISGIHEVGIFLIKPTGDGFGGGHILDNISPSEWSTTVTIPANAEVGAWSFYAYVADNVNYVSHYSHGQSFDQSFEVLSPTESDDDTPPAIEVVEIDKTTVLPGEDIRVTVYATDDSSAVTFMRISYAFLGGGGFDEVYMSSENIVNGVGVADFRIPPYARPGMRYLTVAIVDAAGNEQFYQPHNGFTQTFEVIADPSHEADNTAPTLISLTIDKESVQAGEEITFTVEATDDISGVSSVSLGLGTMDIGYSGCGLPEPYPFVQVDENTWQCSLPIPYNAPLGTWHITYFGIVDHNGNSLSHSIINGFDRSFMVTRNPNHDPDVSPPSLVSVTFDENPVSAGNTLYATIEAVDDLSGIASVSMTLYDPSGNYIVGRNAYEIAPGAWFVDVKIPKIATLGTWQASIRIEDNVNNGIQYDMESGLATPFEVIE